LDELYKEATTGPESGNPFRLHPWLREVLKLADAHQLTPPGPAERWDRMRQARPGMARLPEPPRREFGEFTRRRLENADPNLPRLSPDNPMERELLKREFWEKNKQLLQRMQNDDKAKMEKRPKKPGP